MRGKLRQIALDSRGNTYVFLICLGISVFIWFLVVLSKQSTTTLEYPVNFVSLPEDMILVNKPDSILVFRIESGGFELLTLKYVSRKKPIKIDLGNVNLQKQNGYYSYSYPTTRISADMFLDRSFSDELVSISPESIYLRFEQLKGKMVPVVPNVSLNFEKQYRLKDSLILRPDSVKLVGSSVHLQQINKVESELQNVNGVKSNGRITCKLVNPLSKKLVSIVPGDVEIEYQVEKFTESTLEVPIISNSGENIKFFPAQAKVTFLVSLNDFSRVNKEMFKVVADIPDDRSINTIPVRVTAFPSFVEVSRVNPGKVEYLILKE